MKLCLPICIIVETLLVIAVSSRRILRTESLDPSRLIPRRQDTTPNQFHKGQPRFTVVMGEQAAIPSDSDGSKPPSTTHESLVVSDILSKVREINIFASLTRDFESLSNRLEDGSQNVTVLAPTNTAIEELPHKPWENPNDYTTYGESEAYAGEAGRERATDNLKKFVAAHIIVGGSWPEKKEIPNLTGQKIYWEKDENGKINVCSLSYALQAYGNLNSSL